MRRRQFIVWIAALLVSQAAVAHSLRLGYLTIEQVSESRWSVTWQSTAQDPIPSIGPSSTCARQEVQGAELQRIDLLCEASRDDARVEFVASTDGDIIASIAALAGPASHRVLSGAGAHLVTLRESPRPFAAFSRYLSLGALHVVMGPDHLLFLVAIFLLARGARRLVAIITLFTLGHSATLGAAATGLIVLEPRFTETAIALTLVLAARELWLRRGAARASTLAWMAFFFGLVHGLGFAGSLEQFGLPASHTLLALASFNIGVELGQLGALAVLALARAALSERMPQLWIERAGAYAVGCAGVFWLLERI